VSRQRKPISVFAKLKTAQGTGKIPTTFVSLSPEKLSLDREADLLCGVFHIMWSDMPQPRSYAVRLADLFSGEGVYLGTKLRCSFPSRSIFDFNQ
jgi:hypothetical protein